MSALAVPVVLVDDHQMVLLGLRTLFHNRPEIDVVAFAGDDEEAVACVRAHHPRVVVLDVALEGLRIDGFELCRRLRAEHTDVDVVFYTGVDDLGLAERAFAVARRASSPRATPRPTCSRRSCWPRAGAPTRRPRSRPAPTCATSRTSRPSSWRRCGCSRRGWSARRSPSRWASARRPSRRTSRRCAASSARARRPRPWRSG